MNKNRESHIAKNLRFELHNQHPHVVGAIKNLLVKHSAGLSEHHLIKILQSEGCFDGWISADPTLALFQKHFSVMHCLYHMQPQYLFDGQQLLISPLCIQLLPANPDLTDSTQLTSAVGIQEYYLDWSNFSNASAETVTELLQDFWKEFSAADKISMALEILGLDDTAEWPQVQGRYRRLAAEHHPDKGGDRITFAKVRDAYEILKARLKPQA